MKVKILKIKKEDAYKYLDKVQNNAKNQTKPHDRCMVLYSKNNKITPFEYFFEKQSLPEDIKYVYLLKVIDKDEYWLPNYNMFKNIECLMENDYIETRNPYQGSKRFCFEVGFSKAENIFDLETDIKPFTAMPYYNITVDFDYFDDYFTKQVEKNGLQLNPDFQRGHVWTEKQQREFVEFVLRGGESPKILLNRNEKGFVCVDGLQRITAVTKFLRGELSVFGGVFVDQINSGQVCRKYITVSINKLKTKQEVLYWYIELNSGGTVHTDQEINRVKDLLEKEKNK